jgi:DNA-binding FrmR family transcriptional regulator
MSTVKNNQALLTRVHRITGQTQALEAALTQHTDGSLVLQQIAAIRGAVNGLMVEVLEGHLRAHLIAPDRAPEAREHDMEQVVRVLHSYLK